MSKLATSVLYCEELHSKFSVTQKKKKVPVSISFKVRLRSSLRPDNQTQLILRQFDGTNSLRHLIYKTWGYQS